MGSCADDPSKSIEPSAGGLVWVRRRNGSWWPGRVLGPDELPEGCVPTPRAGTPVKLLGREDASVDWYNLERSKRVKAFRCGDYDECIEKAKASVSNHSKKVVKYARREDAIIHALEIENAHLGKDFLDLSAPEGVHDGEHRNNDESPSSFHPSKEAENFDRDLSGSQDDSDSGLALSQSGVSFEEPDHVEATKEEPRRWRTPNVLEDDATEGVKRMKGLQDLGMGVAATHKRKRSQTTHVNDMKRKNRRHTLTKVLERTAMVSVPVSDQLSSLNGASDSQVFGWESNESKKNNSIVMNNSDSTGVSDENATSLNASKHACDASLRSKQKENEISSMVETPEDELSPRLFDVPLFAEEKNCSGLSTIVSGVSRKTAVGATAESSQSSHAETMSLGNEDNNESGSTSSGTVDIHNISKKLEKGNSEWQLKGKRNLRSRKTDMDDEETYVAGIGGSIFLNSVGCHVKSIPITEFQIEEFRGWSWNAPRTESHTKRPMPMTDSTASQRRLPYRHSRLTVNPKYENCDFTHKHHFNGSGLYDVPLEVKTGYRPQHIPYISLVSKLTSQPITGHPLLIEVLKEGFCDGMLGVSELDYNHNNDRSGSRATNLVCKRRPHGRLGGELHLVNSPTKSPKSKKNGGLLSKKIRKLSSLTGSRKQNLEAVMDKVKIPSIACVPLNIIYSRINAGLNNTMCPAHRPTVPCCK